MANLQFEYKQSIEHTNELPGKFFKICKVSDLITTRYNANLPKTSDPVEFMKRPVRYTFSVYARDKKEDRLPSQNTYLFDDKITAEAAYKKIMCIWIDEQLEPYRKLVAKGLIKEAGKSDLPGRPILDKTTNDFLDYFNIESLKSNENYSRY